MFDKLMNLFRPPVIIKISELDPKKMYMFAFPPGISVDNIQTFAQQVQQSRATKKDMVISGNLSIVPLDNIDKTQVMKIKGWK